MSAQGHGRPADNAAQGFDPAHLQHLIDRSQNGDAQANAELNQLFDAYPTIWQTLGNTSRHSMLGLIRQISGDDPVLGECLRRRVDHFVLDFVEAATSPLERLAAERVVVSYVFLEFAEHEFVAALSRSGETLKSRQYRSKQCALAEANYRAAVRMLREVQKSATAPATTAPTEEIKKPTSKKRKAQQRSPLSTNTKLSPEPVNNRLNRHRTATTREQRLARLMPLEPALVGDN